MTETVSYKLAAKPQSRVGPKKSHRYAQASVLLPASFVLETPYLMEQSRLVEPNTVSHIHLCISLLGPERRVKMDWLFQALNDRDHIK